MKINNIKFSFDSRIKDGFYTANYFSKTKNIVQKANDQDIVGMQFSFFNLDDVMVCGIKEATEMLKASLPEETLKRMKVYGLNDGDVINAKTTVLYIEGYYQDFAIFENVIDSILARRTSVCNNCYHMLKLIKTEQLIFMADRSDDYLLQPYDGYAAYIAGVKNFVTDASVSMLIDKKEVSVSGTIPHALIQRHNGNLVDTLKSYSKVYGEDKLIALVDYNNDVTNEIKLLSKAFKDIFAIRIDTSKALIDLGLEQTKPNAGVSERLILLARETLDQYHFNKTKIIVSSGINLAYVKNIIDKKLPVDFYGIGSSLIERNVHFTADLVMSNGKHSAKYGRHLFGSIEEIRKLKRYI